MKNVKIRLPTDICILCTHEKSSCKNSHIIPVGIYKNCIGKRYHEQSLLVDAKRGKLNTYYGQSNLNNPSTEIKQDHYSRDYIFCPQCEKKLGELESVVIPFLMEKLRDDKYHATILSKNSTRGLLYKYKQITNLDSKDFQVFIYSLIWRLSYLFQIEHDIVTLKENEFSDLRHLIHSSLYEINDKEVEDILDHYAFVILTSKNSDDPKKNVALTFNHMDNPNVFFLFEFVVLMYTAVELIDGKNNQLIDILNYCEEPPKIGLLSNEDWGTINLKLFAEVSEKFLENIPPSRLKLFLTTLKNFFTIPQ